MTFEKIENLKNKVVVITGGYGQVGKAASKRMAELGATVIIISRKNIEEVEKFLETLPSSESQNHRAYLASITDTASIKKVVSDIAAIEAKCDILINAAGIATNIPPTEFKSLTDDLFDKIIINNLRGTFAVIREFYDLLEASGDGLIVNISSVSGSRGSRSNPAYGASKAGVDLITKTMAKTFAPKIRVVAISPGYLENPTSGSFKRPGTNIEISKITPLARVGNSEDIANAIESLCTNMRFVTGQIITVDGGITL
jgi:NAD(P)-dependent dehydrogenase (short-subunit alcohol dehydrogenase family)